MWNGHTSQILSSLHLLQTSPGLTLAIFIAVSSMSISRDLVMGFLIYQANLRKVALPIWDSSGVYAMVLSPFLGLVCVWCRTDLFMWNRFQGCWVFWWLLLIEGIKDCERNQ